MPEPGKALATLALNNRIGFPKGRRPLPAKGVPQPRGARVSPALPGRARECSFVRAYAPVRRCVLGLLLVSASAVPAHAEPAEGARPATPDGADAPDAAKATGATDEAPAVAPELTPPILREFVTAPYPPGAKAAMVEDSVTLRLTIDAQGRVTTAEVLPAADPGAYSAEFAAAAQAAALRFSFEPARRNGQPTPARIRYEYEFRLTDEAAPQPEHAASPAVAPAAPPATAAAPAAQPGSEPARAPGDWLEVAVRGRTRAERMRRSAEAVTVVELEQARQQSADLSEVLSRSQSVGVRRSGGRGSDAAVSLGGLTDDQIRFFVDGIPLPFSGFSLGISTIPVNLLERVELYRGVVPVRFGEDALGGAINLVTRGAEAGSRASASYEVGSFGTYQATVGVQQSLSGSPWFAALNGFWEHARNDYGIDVEVPDAVGRPRLTRVRRLNDDYSSLGGNLRIGFREAQRRFELRTFASRYDKQYPHNNNMTVPYGELRGSDTGYGGSLQYEDLLLEGLKGSAVLGYSLRFVEFDDDSRWAYDWFGRRVFERPVAVGELGGALSRMRAVEHQAIGRLSADYLLHPQHSLRLALSTSFATFGGVDEATGDRLERSSVLSGVAGIEHELSALDRQLSNIVFLKDYLYSPSTDQRATGDGRALRESSSHTQGIGDSLVYRVTDWARAKASYEYATRLPRPDELFGDGGRVRPNPELDAETSHNLNLSFACDAEHPRLGKLTSEVNGFLREASNLIMLLTSNDLAHARHENIFSIRALGVDGALSWLAPGEYVALDGNVTLMDLRNVSEQGPFSPYSGDRIPNRPWLFANASARLQLSGLAHAADQASLAWLAGYVHEFYPSWESLGDRSTKATIPAQLVHTLTFGYLLRSTHATSASFEIQNITNEVTYDFLGVQKPGRSVFFKGTFEH